MSPSTDDRRQQQRIDAMIQAAFYLEVQGERTLVKGLTRDVGEGGLFLFTTEPRAVAVGSELEMMLLAPLPDEPLKILVRARVVRIQETPPYGIAVQFLNPQELPIQKLIAASKRLSRGPDAHPAVVLAPTPAKDLPPSPGDILRPFLGVTAAVFTRIFQKPLQIDTLLLETEERPRGDITGLLKFKGKPEGVLAISFPQATLFKVSAEFYNKKMVTPPQMRHLVFELLNAMGGQMLAILKDIGIEMSPESPEISTGSQRILNRALFPFSYTAECHLFEEPLFVSLFLSINVRFAKPMSKEERVPVGVPKELTREEILRTLADPQALRMLKRHAVEPMVRV